MTSEDAHEKTTEESFFMKSERSLNIAQYFMTLPWVTIFFTFLFLFIPLFSNAQIITEVMYDLEGSDSGREWVEVYNSSPSETNFSTWKFFENGSNHGLVLSQGSEIVSSGGVFVIADNPTKFLIDHPGFGGTIFDSSFSLSNTGETLVLRNDLLEDIDSVSYLSEWGAAGDGNSLNLVNGAWVPLVATPGVFTSNSSSSSEVSSKEPSGSSGGGGGLTVNFPVGTISTKILGEKTVLSGADISFEARSFGVKGEKLENARHLWNFGDGTVLEGERVLHNYIYPGEYVVFLDVSSENFTTSDKFYVSVMPSSLSISQVEPFFIKIKNDSSKDEINISRWILQAGNEFFIIPENTYIRSNGEIIFSGEVTALNGLSRPINLLYPNGRVSYEFQNSAVESRPTTSLRPRENKTEAGTVSQSVEKNNAPLIENVASPVLSVAEAPDNSEFVLEKESGGIFRWILLLAALILLAIFTIVYFKGKDEEVDGFRIIE